MRLFVSRYLSVTTLVHAHTLLHHSFIVHSSERVENEVVEQVCFADEVLLSKTDLVDETKLTEIEAGLW